MTKRVLNLLMVLLLLMFAMPAVAQKKTSAVESSVVQVTLDAKILGSKALGVSINADAIKKALVKAKITTIKQLANADLKKLETIISNTTGHAIKGKKATKKVKASQLHKKASLELASRLKATANVVMSGGSTMFTGLNAGSKLTSNDMGRLLLNPSRTYKQLPDKYNMR